MMVFLLALGTAPLPARPPRVLNPDDLVRVDDYPAQALQNEEYGLVSIVLHVTPQGRADHCAVTDSSGSPLLDSTTCLLAKSRMRFDPARDGDGQAIAGEYRAVMTWGAGAHQPRGLIAMKVGVAMLPPGYVRPVRAQVVFGADGHVATCDVMASSGNGDADKAVCGAITRGIVIARPHSPSSEPAAAVRYYEATLMAENAHDTDAARH